MIGITSQTLSVPIGMWKALAKSSWRMTLTCGTRGAVLHSASVIGRLSGSARAAARRCVAAREMINEGRSRGDIRR